MEDDGKGLASVQERIRTLPPGENPETVMRGIQGLSVWNNRKEVFDYIGDVLEKNPDIEGLVGYSEGSSVGAAYVLHEQERLKTEGRIPQIKCSLWFTGWPPLKADGKPILKDSSDLRVDIPTIHVIGASGEFIHVFPASSLAQTRCQGVFLFPRTPLVHRNPFSISSTRSYVERKN